jgi:hypothetical protein
MKNPIISVLITFVICAVIGWLLLQRKSNELNLIIQESQEKSAVNDLYKTVIENPLQLPRNIEELDSLSIENETVRIHLETIRQFVEQSKEELDTTNYGFIIKQQETQLTNLRSSYEDIKEKKLELENKNLLLRDSLERAKRELNTQLAQKELALASTSKV